MSRILQRPPVYHYSARLVRVVDGDTAILRVRLGFGLESVQRVRFAGLDAPEIFPVRGKRLRLQAGHAARQRVVELLEGQELILRTRRDRRDKFDRLLGEIFFPRRDGGVGFESLNLLLLEERHAVPFGKRLEKKI